MIFFNIHFYFCLLISSCSPFHNDLNAFLNFKIVKKLTKLWRFEYWRLLTRFQRYSVLCLFHKNTKPTPINDWNSDSEWKNPFFGLSICILNTFKLIKYLFTWHTVENLSLCYCTLDRFRQISAKFDQYLSVKKKETRKTFKN